MKKPATRSEATDADLAGVGRYIFTKGNTFSGWPPASLPRAQGPRHAQLPRLAGQQALYLENQLNGSTPASATTTTR